ncbi:MAG: SdrD B-like domain-containing protein, partial [Tateyamaria sp.]|uniref:DUF7507 domain-containing protein n=1 Tax=Tateyamaria sp. TaxID=1929288 RepID=UPI00329C4E41
TPTVQFVGQQATCTANYSVTQTDLDAGQVDNVVLAQTVFGAGNLPVASSPADESVQGLQEPSIELIKSVSNVADTNQNSLFGDAGDTVSYEFFVRNTGNLSLADIIVTDTGLANVIATPVAAFQAPNNVLPPETSGVASPVLAATAEYVLTPADVVAGAVTNTAVVTSTAVATAADGTPDRSLPLAGLDPVTDTSDTGTDPEIDETNGAVATIDDPAADGGSDPTVLNLSEIRPEIRLVKSVVTIEDTNVLPAGDQVLGNAGDTVTYQFTLENVGNTAVAAVSIADLGFAALNGVATGPTVDPSFDGDLAIGEGPVVVATATYVLDQTDVDAAEIVNTATVTATAVATGSNGNPDPNAPIGTAGAVTDLSDTGTEPTADADGNIVAVAGDPALADTNGVAGDDADEPTVIMLPFVPSELSLIGTVFFDDGDGSLGVGESGEAGFVVNLLDSSGNIVATTTTGQDGSYSFEGFAAGEYSVAFLTDEGVTIGVSDPVTVDDPNVEPVVNQPIDPNGIVYDSVTGQGVPGIQLAFVNAATGLPLPDECLLPGQQNQLTSAVGFYAFDLVAGAAPECPVTETKYAIEFVDTGTFTGPSTRILPESGTLDGTTCTSDGTNFDAIPGGACNVSASETPPNPTSPTPYFFMFFLEAGDPNTVNNHIPIDPASAVVPAGTLTLTKRVTDGDTSVILGDAVPYTITVSNAGSNNIPVDLQDRLPIDLIYTPGSGLIDGVAIEPIVSGRTLTWENVAVAPNATVTLELVARVGPGSPLGELTNVVNALDPVTGIALTEPASATIRRLPEAVFDCSDIIGKVFDDRNFNGYQNPAADAVNRSLITDQNIFGGKFAGKADPIPADPEGEPGLPNVRLVTPTGTIITTDEHGRYSVPCAALPDNIGANFTLKLDPRSLPTGYRITTENPRTMRVTAGIATEMNFGAALGRVLDIDLTAAAFDGNEPIDRLDQGIVQLLGQVVDTPAVIRISYFRDGESKQTALNRIAELEDLIDRRWKDIGRYRLIVETQVLRLQ